MKSTDVSAEPEKTRAAVREGLQTVPIRYHRRKDGTVFPVEITAGYFKMGNRSLHTAFIRDISERIQNENERRRLEEHIRNSQKLEALGVLAGGIAHDFNNLLGGIFGFLDMAYEETKDQKVSGFLSKALRTIDRARSLTRQLLTFPKGGAPVREPGDLFPLVQETAQFALSGSKISCGFDVASGLWPANFDKNQIAQVIDNLIINAEQAMPMGGVIKISACNIKLKEQEIPALQAGDYVKLSIKDNGVGIPREILERIFDPFFTTKQKGSGLGLATCYSIITRHDGIIEAESEPGKGSIFHVYLPAARRNLRAAPKKSVVDFKGCGRILLVDDEEVIRESVGLMLEALGYSVLAVNEGKKALEVLVEEKRAGRCLAAVILDLTIPGGMGGVETIAEMRKLDPDIPVFVSSGYSEDPAIADPERYGFTASISKPFVKADLVEKLKRHLKG